MTYTNTAYLPSSWRPMRREVLVGLVYKRRLAQERYIYWSEYMHSGADPTLRWRRALGSKKLA